MTKKLHALILGCSVLLSLAIWRVHADQVEMQNGDRYTGKVLALNTNAVVLQSEVLGTVKLPRDKVAFVDFGTNVAAQVPRRLSLTNSPIRAVSGPPADENLATASALRHLAAHTNLIHHVEDQFLKDAGPEAKAKFDDMLGSLMNGKLDINGLRAQASEAVNQLKALKGDGGEQGGGMLDGYQAILEKFLKETTPSAGSPITNAPASSPVANSRPDSE